MNDLLGVARILVWLAILGLATLVVGTIMGQIQSKVKA
jgi:hypothetical protein